jgi:Tfp pilus assembly protein PilX
MEKYRQGGQALVLVLLSLAVVLTIVLFILSRSITDVSISSSESSSISAFSAAEAGVEQALVVGSAPSGITQIGDASYRASVTNVARGVRSFIYPVELNSGDTVTLWLNSQDSSPDYNGNALRICWGKSGTSGGNNNTPAIEVSLVYGTGSNVRVYRAAIDPYQSRSPNNNFDDNSAGQTISGQSFPFCHTIGNLSSFSNRQFATIRMFYNTNTSHPIAFDSTNNSWLFPAQGIRIDSSGTSGQSSRKVEVFQGWPEVPTVFQFGLYSPSGLTK